MPMKIIGTMGMFFWVFAAIISKPVLAADAPQQCTLSQDKFDELAAIQNDSSLDYLTEMKKELAVRKELLGETMDCAIEEVTSVKTDLSGVTVSDPAIQHLESQLMSQLDNAENYLTLQKSKINDLGLQGSKDFAKVIGEWRDGNYKPAAQNANNLIIWANNQALFQSAQTRINQVSATMALLKIVDNDEIQNLWNEAQVNFGSALKENETAETDLGTFAPPDESSNHIKSSLDFLSSTYKNLLDISGMISKSS